MRILTVIPIARGIFKDELTYFSSAEVKPGAIVSVLVKSRLVPALVISSREAKQLKTALKTAAFALKKIEQVKCQSFFLPEFLAAAETAAEYFAAAVGQVIKGLVPQTILEQSQTVCRATDPSPRRGAARRSRVGLYQDKFVLQEATAERIAFYKSLIREDFAKRASVFFCLPTLADIEETLAALGKGIDAYTIVLHTRLPKKELLRRWQQAMLSDHPILLIATPVFLSLPRTDFGTLIIDRESSPAYKQSGRPFLDIRTVAEILAEACRSRLIFGDSVLRTETIYRAESGELLPISPLKYRVVSSAAPTLINRQNQEKISGQSFAALTPELVQAIAEAHQANERFFLFINRRGLAPLTVCQDCGAIILCERCDSPLVLHQATGERRADDDNQYLCHKCQALTTARRRCAGCGGWRLIALGAGTEKVEKELKERFPELKVFSLNRPAVSAKSGAELVAKFLAAPGSVLVGTEAALHDLHDKVENTAVVSVDHLFTIPDFRIRENILNSLLAVRGLATKRFFIQSRQPQEPVFDYALKGNLADFYREELAERQRFNYPPFTRLIKITRQGQPDEVRQAMKELGKALALYEPLIFPAFTPTVKGKYRSHALIKLPSAPWPDAEGGLAGQLKNLPPGFLVNIDPVDIL